MYDLDLDPMTLIFKFNLDIIKMYHHTKNKVAVSTASKVKDTLQTHTHRLTDRCKHRQYENIVSTRLGVNKVKVIN